MLPSAIATLFTCLPLPGSFCPTVQQQKQQEQQQRQEG